MNCSDWLHVTHLLLWGTEVKRLKVFRTETGERRLFKVPSCASSADEASTASLECEAQERHLERLAPWSALPWASTAMLL